MTDIEQKALALLNKVMADHNVGPHHRLHPATSPFHDALCRAVEQHEAFRQEVSDAVKACGISVCHPLHKFVILKPVDPLVEVLDECGFGVSSNAADDIRAALAARGLKIVKEHMK